ncbi:NAD-glutamate dehydrogenase domain-containing protein [Nitrosophilus kaiyonis]|uniref:NAD-glutamate dehydrogenase domain-containing protein n=1 Tax=Nitrosophilus kaiyonis TaxID=2930200 RepID=UPI002490DABF|nr:NAD-glutamate dehydrogenase domain-containing protein [Nitrosophilus kaiyonis]
MQEKLLSTCKEILSSQDLKISDKILNELNEKKYLASFYEKDNEFFLKIYSQKPLILSEIIPLLHDIGFIIIDEVTYDIDIDNKKIFIIRFLLDIKDKENLIKAKENITEIIEKALKKETIFRCKLYSLTLKENLNLKEIVLIRALIRYENQIVTEFNETAITKTVLKNHSIIKALVDLFIIKFDPTIKNRKNRIKNKKEEIENLLKEIRNINEDKIIRILYRIVDHSLRTNFFLNKETISIKIDTKSLENYLLGIQPAIEIFVYHNKFNGVHLRMGKVSRGGIRWSDRYDDYREEIKSLMSTQEAKNAIIVPSGAKGGFVIYKEKSELSFDEFKNFYSLFIDSLLDLIDNKKDNKIVKNRKIISYDKDDFYFVVAPDKGTSSMSDVANEIAIKRDFWLKDAFASGGSKGYNHKELGVTAKGAWKSVSRFFIEKNIDIYKDSITVVGIGSMRGDVFGNGMLINSNIKLLGAISHNEIFIDPDPNPKISFQERLRLFKKGAHWREYDKSKISEGGGVFSRDAKSITLTPQIKKLLNINKNELNGEELAKKLLCLKVDLLYNGGVGTYVKSSDEINLYLSDKENEGVRVNANELKCFAVCEGGNLGFTQKARIEYARNGGKINLDSIDNSAGVDTSDHEVNLKIVLNSLKDKNIIDENERINTLKSLTDKVLNSVYWTNYLQPLAITLDEKRSKEDLEKFIKTVEVLEKNIKIFKRRDFSIPKPTDFETILTKDGAIVRPILGILLSYSKIFIKQILLKSDFLDSAFARHYLFKYFPKSFVSVYEDEIENHPLKREITATVIANKIINFAGSSFIVDFENLKEEKFVKKIESYLVINQLLNANDIRFELYRSDLKIDSNIQYKLLLELENSINFSVNWMIKHQKNIDPIFILGYKHELNEILERGKKRIKIKEYIKDNKSINLFYSYLEYLKFLAAAIEIKEKTPHSFKDVAKLFFLIIDFFKINEILNIINEYKPLLEYEKKVKFQLEQLLQFFVVKLAKRVLVYTRADENIENSFKKYLSSEIENYENILKEIKNFCTKKHQNLYVITYIVNSLSLLLI